MKHFLLSIAFVLSAAALGAQTNAKLELSVFPNPATEYISVKDNSDLVGEVSVFSIVGRKVKEYTYTKGEQYYIGDLPKGMYLVQLIDHNDRILTTHKMEKR